MKELDLLTLVAVFQEMLGVWLWILVVIAIAGIAAFVALLTREGGLNARRLVQAELAGLLGGVLALVIMAKVSSSGFTDAGGPADWFLIALVFGAGLIGTVILVYAALGFGCRRCTAGRINPPAP